MLRARTFTLAMAVFLAVVVTAPSAASADTFSAETYSSKMKGRLDPESVFKFTTTAGTVSCSQFSSSTQAFAAGTTLPVDPTLSGCTGFFSTVVTMNGCYFLLHVQGGTSTQGDLDVVCLGSGEITITASSAGVTKCIVHIPAQTDLGGTVTYTNVGSGTTREITVDINATGLDYTHTSGTGLGACTAGSATNGGIETKLLFTGEKVSEAVHVGLFMSND